MVLRKPGQVPKLYVGSGTGSYRGMAVRFANHRVHRDPPPPPARALEAWDDGWATACIVPLVMCPKPSAGKVPKMRRVIIALEASFHCLFWSMESPVDPYYFGDNCPWPTDTFEYDGLCVELGSPSVRVCKYHTGRS